VKTDNVILTGTVGSHSYGTNTPTSDYDYMSVVVAEPSVYLGLDSWGSSGTKEVVFDDPEYGVVEHKYFELKKFIGMCSSMNPNVVPLLWLNQEHYEGMTPSGKELIDNRTIFNSKKVYHTFSGYAHSQLQKMGGIFNDAEESNEKLRAGHVRFQGWAETAIKDQRARRMIVERIPGWEPNLTEQYDEGYLNALIALKTHSKEEIKRIKVGPVTGRMGAKRKALREQFGFDCYEESSTEFLTSSGWKKFDDISPDEPVATVNVGTWQTEYQIPEERVDKLYSGVLYTVAPNGSRVTVTPNHKMLLSPVHCSPNNKYKTTYDSKTSDWNYISLEDAMTGKATRQFRFPRVRYHYRRAPEFREKPFLQSNFPDSWRERLLLAGLYLSDGSAQFRNETVKALRLSQTKTGPFVEMADHLLNAVPEKLFGSRHVYQETIWCFHGEIAEWVIEQFGHGNNKRLPTWTQLLAKHEMDVLWAGLMAGDGHQNTRGYDVYYSSLKPLVDSIQAAMISVGYETTLLGPYESTTPYGPCKMYQLRRPAQNSKAGVLMVNKVLGVGEQPEKDSHGRSKGYPIKAKLVENTRIVCFQVPNGNLITRNKGRIGIHGNTKYAFHTIRLMKMCVEFLRNPEDGLKVCRKGIDSEFLYSIRNGALSQEDVKKLADDLFQEAKEAVVTSPLPDEPDYKAINNLTVCLIKASL